MIRLPWKAAFGCLLLGGSPVIGADVTLITVKNAGHNWRSVEGAPTPGVKEIQGITAEFALRQIDSAKATTKN